jgi:adenosine deaminase
MEQEWIRQLPKTDLHCHLDGSMDLNTVSYLLKETGLIIHKDQLEKELKVSEDCQSLEEYLKRFDLPLRCLQTETGLKQAAFDLLKNAAAENVKYLEVRFAPMSSALKGLGCKQIIESVLSGIQAAEQQWDIKASVIVCAMRHYSEEMNAQMLYCAREFLGEGVCALDLAGDEGAFPTKGFRELFQLAKKLDMPFTIHSGECGSILNVEEAIALGAKRLGHGIALIKDSSLMKQCRDKRIGIELCPTSNFQTKAVTAWKDYPLRKFLMEGLLATVNTDNRTVSNTTVTKELIQLNENMGLTEEEIRKLLINSIEISFAGDDMKHSLISEMGR